MKKYWLLSCLVLSTAIINAQSGDSSLLLTLNQQIDDLVVQKDTATLNKLYADDFVFSHGSGKVEGKQGWFKSVVKGSFVTRRHDSVTVEMHLSIAILKGRLSVHKQTPAKTDRYYLKYIRVYALRNEQWQMISHLTYFEAHE